MAVKQVEQETRKKGWVRYLLLGIGVLLSVLMVVVIVFFWEELRDVEGLAQHYGYLGGFLISIFGGITIVPVPSLLVVFTLGGVLNPVYVGLLAGLGEALGGVTVYLTGAGGGAVFSKFRPRRRVYDQSGSSSDNPTSAQPKPRSRWQRLIGWVERRGSSWAVFITSAFVWGLYYPTSLAAGTLRIGLKRFFLISLVGKTVRGMIVAFGGYGGLRFLLQWLGG